MPGYLFIVILLAVLWLFMIRPRQRQMKQRQQELNALTVGDEIVTAGGLYGTVKELVDDDVQVEIAPGVVVRVARRAIASRLTEPVDEPEELDEETDATLPEA